MNNHKSCIYLLTNQVNGKQYVGQTSNLERRLKEHEDKERTAIELAISKYGMDNFELEIVEKVPEEKLNEREVHWISEYNTYKGQGYNLTKGGKATRGWHHDKETREKIRQLASRENLSKETRKQMSESTKEQMKRRDQNGAKNPSSINKEISLIIYNEYRDTNIKQEDLAEKYGVSADRVNKIVNAKHWATEHLNPINKSGGRFSMVGIDKAKEIIKKYEQEDISQRKLAKQVDLHTWTVNKILTGQHKSAQKAREAL